MANETVNDAVESAAENEVTSVVEVQEEPRPDTPLPPAEDDDAISETPSLPASLPTMDGQSVASGSVAMSDLSVAPSVLERARAVLGSRSVAASSSGAVPSERYKVVLKGDASSKIEDDRSTTVGW